MVETNPFNNRECLFIGSTPNSSYKIKGMKKEKITLGCVLDRLVSGVGSYIHQWEEGDLLLWDNLQVIHRAEG